MTTPLRSPQFLGQQRYRMCLTLCVVIRRLSVFQVMNQKKQILMLYVYSSKCTSFFKESLMSVPSCSVNYNAGQLCHVTPYSVTRRISNDLYDTCIKTSLYLPSQFILPSWSMSAIANISFSCRSVTLSPIISIAVFSSS